MLPRGRDDRSDGELSAQDRFMGLHSLLQHFHFHLDIGSIIFDMVKVLAEASKSDR